MAKNDFMIPGIVAVIIILITQAIGINTLWSVILGLIALALSYYLMNK